MFARIKARLNNVKTLKSLCLQAEQHALRDQQRQPGAEHFLLAALDLPDGTAKQVFESIGADASMLAPAIARQYDDALRSIGIDPGVAGMNGAREPLEVQRGIYDASASGQQVLRSLADERQTHDPLLGAHVVAVVAGMKHGVAARSLRAMGIDAGQLKSTAEHIATGVRP
jgi:hypothetical protein